MAASDLSALRGPTLTKTVTLPATVGNVRAVILPAWCAYLSVRLYQSDGTSADAGYLSTENSADDEAVDADAWRIDSGEGLMGYPVADEAGFGPARTVYLAADTASAKARLILQRAAS